MLTSPSPGIVMDSLWSHRCIGDQVASFLFFPSAGIAFTDLPVSTVGGSPPSGLLGADWDGAWWNLQVQGVEPGPFPKQGCMLCCQLESTNRGISWPSFLSSSKACSSSMILSR